MRYHDPDRPIDAADSPTSRALKMRGNQNASRGFPRKKNHRAYPDTNGRPMACDHCFTAHKCPKYQAGAVCAFRKEFKKIDTRDLDGVIAELDALAATQRERLTRGLLYEACVLGGLTTRETGREIDRQRRLLETIISLKREREAIGAMQLSADNLFVRLGLVAFLEDAPRRDGDTPAA